MKTNDMIRLPAEWEPQSFIQFTFPHPNSDWAYMYDEVVRCFVHIINATAYFEPVLVICHSEKEVSGYFKMTARHPIYFEEIESNDTWARDHGVITIFRAQLPELLDFVFNGWGQKFEASLDDQITKKLVEKRWPTATLRSLDFVLEGGAIESDGHGTLLTTSACLLSKFRNSHMDKSEISEYLTEVFGLKKILWLDHGFLEGDDTDSHIDTLARFCNQDTIAYVQCNDDTDEHFKALQAMEEQLKTFKTEHGAPYNLVPLPWPQACYDAEGARLPATYANFLIVNNGVLVPMYNVPQDEEALTIIQNLFPDREVIGVDCRPLIEQHGSLHCISMQYPDGVSVLAES